MRYCGTCFNASTYKESGKRFHQCTAETSRRFKASRCSHIRRGLMDIHLSCRLWHFSMSFTPCVIWSLKNLWRLSASRKHFELSRKWLAKCFMANAVASERFMEKTIKIPITISILIFHEVHRSAIWTESHYKRRHNCFTPRNSNCISRS